MLFNGSAIVTKTINMPWLSAQRAKRVMPWGTSAAYRADTEAVYTYAALDGGRGWRKGYVLREFNGNGNVSQVSNFGQVGLSGDESCTKYTYAPNTTAHMLTYSSRVVSYSVSCDTTPTLPGDFISHAKIYYDDPTLVHGTAPTKGDVVKVEEVTNFSGTTPTWTTQMTREFDAYGRETKTTNAAGKSASLIYTDTNGLLTSVKTTNLKGFESTTHIDPAWGVPHAEIDPNGQRTDLTYDPLGRVHKVWFPGQSMSGEPHNSEFLYDIRNSGPSVVTTRTRRNDGTYGVGYELYDGLLRSRQTQLPAPGGGRVISETRYDSRGMVVRKLANYTNVQPPATTLFTPNGDEVPSATAFVYDGAGRVTTETLLHRDNFVSKRVTDYGGDRVRITPPKGGTPSMQITDIGGRTLELHQYDGATPTGTAGAITKYSYDPRGNLRTVTDATGKNVWTTEYNYRGLPSKVHDPDKGTTQLTYDILGRVSTSTDAEGRMLTHTYDELSRKTGLFLGANTSGTKLAEWKYDTVLLPDLVTPAKGMPASSTRFQDGLSYTTTIGGYDENYRPTKTIVGIPTKDGLTKYTTGTGTLAGNHLFSTSYNFDGTPQTHSLPAAGDLAREVMVYTYDLYGMPKRTTGDSTYVTDSLYSKTGQLTQLQLSTGGPKTFRTFEYDEPTDQLTRAYTTRDVQAGVELNDVRYSYDPAGNLTSIADTPTDGTAADTQCFSYDYLRRLSNAWTAKTDCSTAPTPATTGTTVGGPAPYWHSYSYDVTGNRETEVLHGLGGAADTTRTYTSPAAGAVQPHTLTSVNSKTPPVNGQPGIEKIDSFTYDKTGNTRTRTLNGTTQTLDWDAEGHLTKVTEGTKTTSFVYDADGNRLLRKDNTGTTLYLGEQELFLSATNGTVKGTRFITHGGSLVAAKTAATVKWMVSDHQGTAEMAIDAAAGAGQGVQRRYQTPYGNPRTGQRQTLVADKGFVGGTFDPSTGLTHLGAREYDPATGRFVSVDPVLDVGQPQQMHGYSYANNSPVTFSDPSGLWTDGPRDVGTPCSENPAACGYEKDWKPASGGTYVPPPVVLTPAEQHNLNVANKVKQKSLTQVILETGGAVLLDVIGVTDIYNCVKGSIGSCISAVAGAVPFWKLGKFVKAVGRAALGVLKWIDDVRWADNVIKAANDKIAQARRAAENAKNKADDLPDINGKKQSNNKPDDGGGNGNGDPPSGTREENPPPGEYGPFHRRGSRTQTTDDLRRIRDSGQLWGRAPRNIHSSDIPAVQAYTGPMPDGLDPGSFEFYTNVRPDRGSIPGEAMWRGPREGVIVEDDWAKIEIFITRYIDGGA